MCGEEIPVFVSVVFSPSLNPLSPARGTNGVSAAVSSVSTLVCPTPSPTSGRPSLLRTELHPAAILLVCLMLSIVSVRETRWTRVVCCCWTTGAFTSCSRWRPLPSQDVLLRRRLPNSPLLTWVAFPPHPGPLTLRHGLLLQGGWRSSTAAAAEAAGQPGMLVGVVQQFVIALLWVQYRSPSVPVIDGHGNDAVQTRGSALVSSVHGGEKGLGGGEQRSSGGSRAGTGRRARCTTKNVCCATPPHRRDAIGRYPHTCASSQKLYVLVCLKPYVLYSA